MARDMKATEAVAGEIRAELARQRLTQAWLADEIGVDRSVMSRKLGGRSSLTVEDAVRAAEVLDIPIVRLFSATALAA
jgi:transcriptional regulator with XRE-family HTH domain